MLQSVRCLFGRHRVDRQRVWNDTLNMRGVCRGCKTALLRDIDGWRPFSSRDYSEKRLPHPRADSAPQAPH
jgi:hypothetical protein